WALRVGERDENAAVPGSPHWDQPKLLAFDFPLSADGIHPDASPEDLDLSSQWLTWGTYADDYYPAVFGRKRDIVGAKASNERLKGFMPVDEAPAASVPANALERSVADLWARTAGPMSPGARRKFRAAIGDMLDSFLWEMANHLLNRIPDPVDYVEMRRQTFGSDLTMSLSRLAHGDDVPAEIYETATMRALESAAMD